MFFERLLHATTVPNAETRGESQAFRSVKVTRRNPARGVLSPMGVDAGRAESRPRIRKGLPEKAVFDLGPK